MTARGVTVLATTGAIVLTVIWTFAAVNFLRLTVFGGPAPDSFSTADSGLR